MATTFVDIINQVSLNLHGFADDQESRTHVTVPILATDLVVSVADASNISSGVGEIEDELVWITGVDTTNNLVTLGPYGRGFSGSTAATHAAGAVITSSPRWPRDSIKRNINHVIGQVYPDLYAVKQTTLTSVSAKLAYPLPADCNSIMWANWQAVGPTGEWVPLNRYRLEVMADLTAFPTGRSLSIFNPMTPGRNINVVYQAPPSRFVNLTDTLIGTGLGPNTEDILVYGATARMIQQYEAARLQVNTVAETERAQFVTGGAATAASRALYALYGQRIDEERRALQRLYPTRMHFSR